MEKYTKVLVAKYSPKNACNVPDGEVLTVVPKKNVSLGKDAEHRFLSSVDKSTRSKFGWVAETQPFTLDEFIASYLGGEKVEDDEKNHIRIMLSCIASLAVDTPVAATYFVRGDLDRRAEFKVHKVFFYHPKPTAAGVPEKAPDGQVD